MRSLRDLTAGMRYRVLRTFVDFDGDDVAAGTELTFVAMSYFPYDGGYTLQFVGRTVRVAEIDPVSCRVIEQPGAHFECLDGP